MTNKIYKVYIIIFMLGFIINLFLVEFYKEVNQYNEILTIDNLSKISQMNISGSDLYKIKNYCEENKIDFPTYLARFMMVNDFEVESVGDDLAKDYYKVNNKYIEDLYNIIFNDIECFPIYFSDSNEVQYTYDNSFLAPRTYGGERKHLGIDIIDSKNESGRLKIVSMSDGVIENLGWLELGGYRVGIRSNSGVYFYYAHLDSYVEGLKEGDKVEAGDVIGYMGDTGYGQEGTRGKFVVHLHLGVMLPAINEIKEEIWINPYPILNLYDNNFVVDNMRNNISIWDIIKEKNTPVN